MRMSLLLRLLLATAGALLASASFPDNNDDLNRDSKNHQEKQQNQQKQNSKQLQRLTVKNNNNNNNSSNNNRTNNHYEDNKKLNPKERDKAIESLEASLLSLLGFTKRPKPVGKTHVPDQLMNLYTKQLAMGMANIAKPGLGTNSANTVRSFVHVGRYKLCTLKLNVNNRCH